MSITCALDSAGPAGPALYVIVREPSGSNIGHEQRLHDRQRIDKCDGARNCVAPAENPAQGRTGLRPALQGPHDGLHPGRDSLAPSAQDYSIALCLREDSGLAVR